MDTEDVTDAYPGRGLGRAETGPGSLARPGRRLLSLLIDWLICLLIATGFGNALGVSAGREFYPLLVLLVENLLLVPTAGATIGQRLVGVATERVDGGRLDLGPAAIRAVLLVLFLPVVSLIWQKDLRGGHDLAAGAVVSRTG